MSRRQSAAVDLPAIFLYAILASYIIALGAM
jgi:hypothetical protein